MRELLPTGAPSDSVCATNIQGLFLYKLVDTLWVGGLIGFGTYKRTNEAMRRELRYWADRGTSHHYE